MEILAIIAFVIVGVAAGLTAGLLGLSGGVIAVPSLVLIFHLMDFPNYHLMHTAVGTSLAAMVINGIASVSAHHKHGAVMWDVVLSAVPGILLGCLLGSFLAHFMSSILLQILFGLFVCILGAYVLLHKKKTKETKRPDKTLFTWIGLGIGTLASMLGIGGGTFTVPMLISYRYPARRAVGTSAAIGFVITFLASMAYLYFGLDEIDLPWHFGYIYLPAFGVIGLTSIFFARLGAKIANTIDSEKLKKIFAATLILIGILMIFN